MIYVASKIKHAHIWLKLKNEGLPISSTWIYEAAKDASKDLMDLWCRCINEASKAEVLLAYCEPGDILKGALIEIGAALAHDVPVVLVGFEPKLTFLNHPHCYEAPSLQEAIRWIKELLEAK